jgi:hypothetical protein
MDNADKWNRDQAHQFCQKFEDGLVNGTIQLDRGPRDFANGNVTKANLEIEPGYAKSAFTNLAGGTRG